MYKSYVSNLKDEPSVLVLYVNGKRVSGFYLFVFLINSKIKNFVIISTEFVNVWQFDVFFENRRNAMTVSEVLLQMTM